MPKRNPIVATDSPIAIAMVDRRDLGQTVQTDLGPAVVGAHTKKVAADLRTAVVADSCRKGTRQKGRKRSPLEKKVVFTRGRFFACQERKTRINYISFLLLARVIALRPSQEPRATMDKSAKMDVKSAAAVLSSDAPGGRVDDAPGSGVDDVDEGEHDADSSSSSASSSEEDNDGNDATDDSESDDTNTDTDEDGNEAEDDKDSAVDQDAKTRLGDFVQSVRNPGNFFYRGNGSEGSGATNMASSISRLRPNPTPQMPSGQIPSARMPEKQTATTGKTVLQTEKQRALAHGKYVAAAKHDDLLALIAAERASSSLKGNRGAAASTDTLAAKLALKKLFKVPATLTKLSMNPYLCQHPQNRVLIQNNVKKMMEDRGYRWVKHETSSTAAGDDGSVKGLLPVNNKMVLSFYDMHAIKDNHEPVYVVFCLQAGEPTLKSIQYPSRHVILVSDKLIAKARVKIDTQRALMRQRHLNFPALALGTSSPCTPTPQPVEEAKRTKEPMVDDAADDDSKEQQIKPKKAKSKKKPKFDVPGWPTHMTAKSFTFNDVYIEAFASASLRFSLLEHRYNASTNFKLATPADLKIAADIYDADIHKYPLVMTGDPISRHFGLVEGQVIKEETASSTAGIVHSYRTVSSKRDAMPKQK